MRQPGGHKGAHVGAEGEKSLQQRAEAADQDDQSGDADPGRQPAQQKGADHGGGRVGHDEHTGPFQGDAAFDGHGVENVGQDARQKHQLDRSGKTERPGEENGVAARGLLARSLFGPGRGLHVFDEKKAEDERHEHQPGRAEKGALVPQRGGGQRAQRGAQQLTGSQCVLKKAHVASRRRRRRRGGHHDQPDGGNPAENALHHPQGQQQRQTGHEPHQENQDGVGQQAAHEEHFGPVARGQGAPQGGGHGRHETGGPHDETHPDQGLRVGIGADFVDVKGNEHHDEIERKGDAELRKGDEDHIPAIFLIHTVFVRSCMLPCAHIQRVASRYCRMRVIVLLNILPPAIWVRISCLSPHSSANSGPTTCAGAIGRVSRAMAAT